MLQVTHTQMQDDSFCETFPHLENKFNIVQEEYAAVAGVRLKHYFWITYHFAFSLCFVLALPGRVFLAVFPPFFLFRMTTVNPFSPCARTEIMCEITIFVNQSSVTKIQSYYIDHSLNTFATRKASQFDTLVCIFDQISVYRNLGQEFWIFPRLHTIFTLVTCIKRIAKNFFEEKYFLNFSKLKKESVISISCILYL